MGIQEIGDDDESQDIFDKYEKNQKNVKFEVQEVRRTTGSLLNKKPAPPSASKKANNYQQHRT